MNNKRVLFFLYGANLSIPETFGVRNKVMAQCAAFTRLGYAVTLLYNKNNLAIFKDYNGGEVSFPCPLKSRKGFDFTSAIREYLTNTPVAFNLVFIRKLPCTINYIKSIKELRKHAKLVVCEIPTYPYDWELRDYCKKFSGSKKIKEYLFFYYGDKILRRFLKKYIDCFAVVTDDPNCIKVFGAPVIAISNGTDVDNMPIRNRSVDSTISVLGVATVVYCHGYDRLVSGIYNYYSDGGTKKIIFNIAGNGDAIPDLKKLVHDLKLEEHIIFHGFKTGDELNALFDQADIGAAHIGVFRGGFTYTSGLKIREYCARGLPYIVGTGDTSIPSTSPWVLQISNDDTPVDINQIIDFYNKTISNPELQNEMRDFAQKNLSWDTQLQKIIDFASLLT